MPFQTGDKGLLQLVETVNSTGLAQTLIELAAPTLQVTECKYGSLGWEYAPLHLPSSSETPALPTLFSSKYYPTVRLMSLFEYKTTVGPSKKMRDFVA